MTFVVSYPSTVVDDSSGGGTVTWSNPANAETPNSIGSVAAVTNGLTTHRLKATNFSFALANNTVIKGIEVLINAKVNSTATIAVQEFDVKLLKAGVPVSSNKAQFTYNVNPGSFAIYLHGSTSDLWGTTWNASDVNNSGFGVYIQLRNPSAGTQTDTVEVDYLEAGIIYITIYSEVGSGGVVLGGSSVVTTSEKLSGGAAVAGESWVTTNPTYGGVVVGGTSICQMDFFVTGADGIYFLPQSITAMSGWTGPLLSIQEGVNNEDGDTSFIRGVNPTADYIFINFGMLTGLAEKRRIGFRVCALSESLGGSLIMGLYVGPTNVGNITVSPPAGSYGIFEFDSPPSTVNHNFSLTGYLFPMPGPAIRVTAADIITTSTSAGGASPNTSFIMDTGGFVVGGISNVSQVILAQGGAVAGGSGIVTSIYNHIDGLAPIVSGGLSPVFNFIPSTGGMVIGGSWGVYSGILVAGGIVCGGTSNNTIIAMVVASGGCVTGGSAIKADLHIFFADTLGGVFISGNDDAGVKDRHYIPVGQVTLGGSSAARIEFEVDLTLNWNIRAAIFKDIDLIWNVGQLPVFWYRVIGKGHDGTQCNLVADPCCQKYIVNIHARTPSELCQKLSSLNLNMPIDSVQKFTRPAESAVIAADAAKGITHDCNQLVQVDVCQIPSCADLCIDFDITMTFGFNFTVQSNAFHSYDANGSVSVSGFAGTREVRNVPSFHYIAAGGVQTTGSSDILASFINARGGGIMGGSAHLQSNRWTYVGGVWPYHVAGLGETAESVSSL